ncbi:MAG: redoxin domain-containing protein [Methanobacteriota archaeon]
MDAELMRRTGLVAPLVVIAGLILLIEKPWGARSTVPPAPEGLPASELQYPAAPDFGGATGWLQSEPLDLVSLRGKVVLVDFWTYSCINCIHTFPFLREWHDRYAADGLVIVGVHSPEFRFERDPENVARAAEKYGLEYAIAIDNDYQIWRAYQNRFWPAEYLIDSYGRVRHTHFGEGGYAETEAMIRALLTEAGRSPSLPPSGRDEDGRRASGVTPELYAAAAQGPDRVAIGNPEGYRPPETVSYARPSEVARDKIFLVGSWQNNEQNVTAVGDGTSVLVRFRAAAANVVLDGPSGACIEVRLDGAPAASPFAASDVSLGDGRPPCIVLDGPRSYDFFEGPVSEHTVELVTPSGVSLFTFAFTSRTGEDTS